jgi:hypothetical protein
MKSVEHLHIFSYGSGTQHNTPLPIQQAILTVFSSKEKNLKASKLLG